MSFNDDYEETLCTIKKCHVFKLPPRTSAEGYKADGWNQYHLWTGRLRVVARGLSLEIRLEHSDTGKLFALCNVNTSKSGPQSIEPVVDSSRYFVLRIEKEGKHAFIGIGFEERSEAFDFNVAIQNHQKFVENANKPQPELKDDPSVDYSMKQGEKITINLKVKTKGQTKVSPASTPKSGVALGDGGLLLPPPPSGGHKAPVSQPRAAPQRAAPAQQAAKQSGGMDDFADILAPSKPVAAPPMQRAAPQQQQPKPQGSSALDDFLL